MPRMLILAGPNGAGKTTFAREYLANEAGCPEFVNADLIAGGISPLQPASADLEAGRVMVRRVRELLGLRKDLAIETTLSGSWVERAVHQGRVAGYFIELHFVRVANVEIAIRRVGERARAGGHDVAPEVVRRRFVRGAGLLESRYKGLVDRWSVYDNSGESPVLVAQGGREDP